MHFIRLQTCWYWKFLSESDQIWMPKCLRFGWTPKHTPSPYESNVWKRVYSFNIQALQTMPVRVRISSINCVLSISIDGEQMNILVPFLASEIDSKRIILSNDACVQTRWTGVNYLRIFCCRFCEDHLKKKRMNSFFCLS